MGCCHIIFCIGGDILKMAEYLTTDTELTSIANAIRAKGGTVAPLEYPSEFVSAINAIATVGVYQSKSVTPGAALQVITPDTGYVALDVVNVYAIPYAETENLFGGLTVTIGPNE